MLKVTLFTLGVVNANAQYATCVALGDAEGTTPCDTDNPHCQRGAADVTSTCVNTCDPGYIAVNNLCTTCAGTFLGDGVTSSPIAHNDACIAVCPDGVANNAGGNGCDDCAGGKFSKNGAACATCDGQTDDVSEAATIFGVAGVCLEKCPAGHIQDGTILDAISNNVIGCKPCANEADDNGDLGNLLFSHNNDQCLDVCPDGFDTFADTNGNDCVQCGTGFTSTGGATCSDCGAGKYTDDNINCDWCPNKGDGSTPFGVAGVCLENCPDGHIPDTGIVDGSDIIVGCKPCGEYETASSGATVCTVCAFGEWAMNDQGVYDNTCKLRCAAGS